MGQFTTWRRNHLAVFIAMLTGVGGGTTEPCGQSFTGEEYGEIARVESGADGIREFAICGACPPAVACVVTPLFAPRLGVKQAGLPRLLPSVLSTILSSTSPPV
eukprot:TRINITY_DN25421_c0_g1_i1.p3 TRINITY_DN25421_c0_g1~~TRINITY_DN25421_c0_g1_i1.p3  ORF type:complete len:104 (+),score=11.30 TRINITY_DN25421_c0_g1_i1:11-322(+)